MTAGGSAKDDWQVRCLAVRNDFGLFLASLERLPVSQFVDDLLIRAFEECWLRPEQLVSATAHYLTAKWPRALRGIAAPNEPQLADVVRDPVLLAMLRMTPAATPGLDVLLARVRFGVLHSFMTGGDVASFAPTMAALAVRGWHSGYASTLPLSGRHDADRAVEVQMVGDLGRQLEASQRSSDAALALVIYAAFAQPSEVHLPDALASGDPLAAMIAREVVAPSRRQRAIARDLVSVTPMDTSSALVAGQYEVHPYPAWVGEPSDNVELPPAVLAALGSGGVEAIKSVLVAGCGTGQHALAAACAWPNADVLAIDISRTSLAYAIDRAAEAHGGRIRFELADLLQVEKLACKFQVIETMGVLHHLDDPEAGLQALSRVLEPDGLIGIGLYSAAARTTLDTIRARYGPGDMRSDEAVRHFRAWALTELARSELLYSPDFYSIGGVRDAFFHVRERCYSLPEIGAMIDAAGLRLIAIAQPPRAAEWLETIPAPDDLEGWAEAERNYPDLFIGMYEIWAQLRG